MAYILDNINNKCVYFDIECFIWKPLGGVHYKVLIYSILDNISVYNNITIIAYIYLKRTYFLQKTKQKATNVEYLTTNK